MKGVNVLYPVPRSDEHDVWVVSAVFAMLALIAAIAYYTS
jgi:hypothetical protein